MSNATVSTVLGFILLLSALSVGSISDVYAKSMPSARPELSLAISISQDEPKLEDGKIIYERQHMTEEKLQILYNDMEKVDRIFDTVMLPAVNDFVEMHMEDIDEKYTDEIHITYYRENDRIDIMFVQHPEGLRKSVQIIPESSVRLEMIDNIRVKIPVSTMILYGDNPLRYLMPNTSVRVGYLSNYMEELIKKYQNEIIDSNFRTILSFMLDDMSKTTIYLDEHRITEYETGIDLVLDNPNSVYQTPEFSTNTPILIVKSSNYPLTVSCSSPDGDITKMTSTLTYPTGEEVSTSSKVVRNPYYTGIEVDLNAEEPEGLYEFILNDAEPKKLVYCSMNVNRGNDYPFEYVDRSTYSEPTLDRGWQAYEAETWCNYSRLMTVESPDASIVDERTGGSTTVYEWLSQFGEFESTWSNVHFDSTIPTYFLTAVKWRSDNLSEIYGAMKAFNSLQPDMKHGRELSMYFIAGDCVSAEGREFNVETETSYIIEEMKFSLEEKKISYVIDSDDRTRGLFKVTVPKELLAGNFTLMVDGKPHYVTESVASSVDDTQTVLTYWHEGSAKNIEVIGTEAIPEFPFALIVLAGSIVGVIVASRWFQMRASYFPY